MKKLLLMMAVCMVASSYMVAQNDKVVSNKIRKRANRTRRHAVTQIPGLINTIDEMQAERDLVIWGASQSRVIAQNHTIKAYLRESSALATGFKITRG